MDLLEKVEKLRQKADVSYEDAKAALEETDGDILEALILLEKQGKTKTPENETYSTKYDRKELLVVDNTEKNSSGNTSNVTFTDKIKAFWRKLCVNALEVERKGERVIKLPLWMFILAVAIGWQIVPIIIVISLFFGCHYTFTGEDEMKMANDISDKADEVVEHVKDEFNSAK